jgi:hypothetical protein
MYCTDLCWLRKNRKALYAVTACGHRSLQRKEQFGRNKLRYLRKQLQVVVLQSDGGEVGESPKSLSQCVGLDHFNPALPQTVRQGGSTRQSPPACTSPAQPPSLRAFSYLPDILPPYHTPTRPCKIVPHAQRPTPPSPMTPTRPANTSPSRLPRRTH